MPSRKKHPNKEIEAAVKHAESLGWRAIRKQGNQRMRGEDCCVRWNLKRLRFIGVVDSQKSTGTREANEKAH